MISEALDFKYLLLENYKKIKIHEDELAVILMIDHLLNDGNAFITADLLSLKMTLSTREIDTILAALITRGFLEYKTKGKETFCSLDSLKETLMEAFETQMSKSGLKKSNEIKKKVNKAVKLVEEFLGKKLSPLEIDMVNEWVVLGYSEMTISDACKESLAKGNKTINNVDKILAKWQMRNDIETDGISTITPDWNKSLEETIKIAKTPWLDDDDLNDK